MLLCIDAGNTNIKFGLFDNGKMTTAFKLSSERSRTADEFGVIILSLLKNTGLTEDSINGVIISSVVPPLNYTLERACEYYLKTKPLMVGPGIKTGLNLKVDNPKEVGADRIATSVCAYKKYGAPAIVVDFGTATTFSAINAKGEFIGGVISPGIKGSLDSLINSTAKLPNVEIKRPSCAIGRNTITNMQAGIVFGFAGLVKNIVEMMKEELLQDCDKTPIVIGTGGFSEIIGREAECIDYFDRLLALEGLKILYEINQSEDLK